MCKIYVVMKLMDRAIWKSAFREYL